MLAVDSVSAYKVISFNVNHVIMYVIMYVIIKAEINNIRKYLAKISPKRASI